MKNKDRVIGDDDKAGTNQNTGKISNDIDSEPHSHATGTISLTKAHTSAISTTLNWLPLYDGPWVKIQDSIYDTTGIHYVRYSIRPWYLSAINSYKLMLTTNGAYRYTFRFASGPNVSITCPDAGHYHLKFNTDNVNIIGVSCVNL